jgi:hypothetical protein
MMSEKSIATAEPEKAAPVVDRERHDSRRVALFDAEQAERLRGRWHDTQTALVDDPRAAVQRADALVAEVVQALSAAFTRQRETLERQMDGKDTMTTEDLRLALQRYRSFFDRLLSLE